jgi:hypothetical protein
MIRSAFLTASRARRTAKGAGAVCPSGCKGELAARALIDSEDRIWSTSLVCWSCGWKTTPKVWSESNQQRKAEA